MGNDRENKNIKVDNENDKPLILFSYNVFCALGINFGSHL